MDNEEKTLHEQTQAQVQAQGNANTSEYGDGVMSGAEGAVRVENAIGADLTPGPDAAEAESAAGMESAAGAEGMSDIKNANAIGTEAKTKEKFAWNKKYLSICFYAIIVVLASVLIIRIVMGWEMTAGFLKRIFTMIAPFLWGAFIAFLMNPLVMFMDGRIFGKIKWIKTKQSARMVLSILFSYVLVILSLFFIVRYLVPQIWNSIVEIFSQVPSWINQVNNWLLEFEENNPEFDFEVVNQFVNDLTPQLIEMSKNIVTTVAPFIFTTSISVMKVLINILVAVMVSVYIITDKRILASGFTRVLYGIASEKTANVIMKTIKECYHIFSKFVFGKAVDSFIIGCLCFILMTIFQFPFAPIISLIVGITNMIPYFGPFIGAVPGVILTFMVAPLKSLFFALLILVIQQFDGLFLGPKILGETVGLRPLWIIFAITIGGSIGGVIGMFLGVPVVAVLAYLLEQLLDKIAKKKKVDIG